MVETRSSTDKGSKGRRKSGGHTSRDNDRSFLLKQRLATCSFGSIRLREKSMMRRRHPIADADMSLDEAKNKHKTRHCCYYVADGVIIVRIIFWSLLLMAVLFLHALQTTSIGTTMAKNIHSQREGGGIGALDRGIAYRVAFGWDGTMTAGFYDMVEGRPSHYQFLVETDGSNNTSATTTTRPSRRLVDANLVSSEMWSRVCEHAAKGHDLFVLSDTDNVHSCFDDVPRSTVKESKGARHRHCELVGDPDVPRPCTIRLNRLADGAGAREDIIAQSSPEAAVLNVIPPTKRREKEKHALSFGIDVLYDDNEAILRRVGREVARMSSSVRRHRGRRMGGDDGDLGVVIVPKLVRVKNVCPGADLSHAWERLKEADADVGRQCVVIAYELPTTWCDGSGKCGIPIVDDYWGQAHQKRLAEQERVEDEAKLFRKKSDVTLSRTVDVLGNVFGVNDASKGDGGDRTNIALPKRYSRTSGGRVALSLNDFLGPAEIARGTTIPGVEQPSRVTTLADIPTFDEDYEQSESVTGQGWHGYVRILRSKADGCKYVLKQPRKANSPTSNRAIQTEFETRTPALAYFGLLPPGFHVSWVPDSEVDYTAKTDEVEVLDKASLMKNGGERSWRSNAILKSYYRGKKLADFAAVGVEAFERSVEFRQLQVFFLDLAEKGAVVLDLSADNILYENGSWYSADTSFIVPVNKWKRWGAEDAPAYSREDVLVLQTNGRLNIGPTPSGFGQETPLAWDGTHLEENRMMKSHTLCNLWKRLGRYYPGKGGRQKHYSQHHPLVVAVMGVKCMPRDTRTAGRDMIALIKSSITAAVYA